MESEYYEIIRTINTTNPNILVPTIHQPDMDRLKIYLVKVDEQLARVFKGAPVEEPAMTEAVNMANLLLTVVLERPTTESSVDFIQNVCKVCSLWNLKVGNNDDLENILTATLRLIQMELTLTDLLIIYRRLLPQLRQLSFKPMAFDIAPHYIKQLLEEEEEV